MGLPHSLRSKPLGVQCLGQGHLGSAQEVNSKIIFKSNIIFNHWAGQIYDIYSVDYHQQ